MNKPLAAPGDDRLVVRDIWKAYRREQVLRGVSLQIKPGEILGLCGANGVGKTTLLNIIASIMPADRGEIALLGVPISRQTRYRSVIGYVPQNIALSPRLTVRRNLLFWAALAGNRTHTSQQQAVSRVAELARLHDVLDKPVNRCSGGMARRANLAAGLVGQPRLILLDEPTAGIDSDSRDAILDSLARLREQGCMILMINHYEHELARICDRIATLSEGRILEANHDAG